MNPVEKLVAIPLSTLDKALNMEQPIINIVKMFSPSKGEKLDRFVKQANKRSSYETKYLIICSLAESTPLTNSPQRTYKTFE